MYLFKRAIFTSCLLLASTTFAGPQADALGRCLKDNTSATDRKELAKWVFVALSTHPEIRPLSNIPESKRDEFDRHLADLSTRLITENCKAEAREALRQEGVKAFETAFGLLGEVAMEELMSHPDVSASVSRYTKYLDKSKFEALVSE
ncbi:MAG: hypothetical protein JNM27_05015 [Leptospirales bacterium]|nr:hypothetical protein [Leptospirales bacterium]